MSTTAYDWAVGQIHAENDIRTGYNSIMSYLGNREKLRTVPDHIQRALDGVRTMEAAKRHTITTAEHAQIIQLAKQAIEADLAPMAKRREFEGKLARMIQRQVLPRYKAIDPTLADLPEKLRNCRTCGRIGTDPAGDKRFHWDHKCNLSKVCPDEARYEAERLANHYIPALLGSLADHPGSQLQKCVISPLNVRPGRLHDAKRALYRAWSNLNRRKVCAPIKGAMVVQEDPAAKAGDWNVHLNVICVVSGHFSWAEFRRQLVAVLRKSGIPEWSHVDDCQVEWLTEPQMRSRCKAKRAARGVVDLVDRTGILIDQIKEMVKYHAKITGNHDSTGQLDLIGEPVEAPAMYEWSPSLWFEWWRSNKGFRRTRAYGDLYNAPAPVEEEAGQVEWFGFIRWDSWRKVYTLHTPGIDLIPADKFAEPGRFSGPYGGQPPWPTG